MSDCTRTVVGITGARGLLGTHTRARLHVESNVRVLAADRTTLEDDAAYERFVARCDAIVHYAGLNRGGDHEVRTVNVELAERLVRACDRSKRVPHLLFASSTHIDRNTAYGEAKRAVAARFASWASSRGARFTNLILPHVFGEGGKPFHNSAVSTFAHQIVAGIPSTVESDGRLELVHAGDVASLVRDAIAAGTPGELRVKGVSASVGDVFAWMRDLDATYRDGTVPNWRDDCERALFNVLRWERFAREPVRDHHVRADQRGTLFETVRTLRTGQSFVSTTKPGVTRGEHFHFKKLERFVVLRGRATIAVRHLFSDVSQEFEVCAERPQFIDMPTLHPHNITNTGAGDLITQFWTDELFDPDLPDTFAEPVGNAASRRSASSASMVPSSE